MTRAHCRFCGADFALNVSGPHGPGKCSPMPSAVTEFLSGMTGDACIPALYCQYIYRADAPDGNVVKVNMPVSPSAYETLNGARSGKATLAARMDLCRTFISVMADIDRHQHGRLYAVTFVIFAMEEDTDG